MTRDELERCARFLDQGLSLDRDMQKRLVLHALGNSVRKHLDGCAWWRGAGCDCTEATETLDLGVKTALVVGPDIRDYWEHRCDADDRLYCVPKGKGCATCGERQVPK